MDGLMLILLCIIVAACLLFGIYMHLYNSIQDYIIRINEVESIIDTNLRNKYDQINKEVAIVKNDEKLNAEINLKEFDDLIRLKNKKISNFDMDRKLIEANNNFESLKRKHEALNELKDLKAISKKIEQYDELLEVNRDYYNKNIAEYNKLVTLFPTNIVAKICKYKEKLFFDRKDMSDNDFEDFKL